MDEDDKLISGPDGELITQAEHKRLHRIAVYCAPPPRNVTEAAQRFLTHGHEVIHYAGSVRHLARKMDDTLAHLGLHPPEVIGYVDAIKRYSRLEAELLVSRTVDLFLTYTANLLADIFTTRPETLRSGAQVRLDYVLTHSSMEELTRNIADQQVNKLAFKGFRQLHEALQRQLGLTLIPDAAMYAEVALLIECRNLITHNHGLVNAMYKSRVSDSSEQLGSPVTIPKWDYLTELAHAVLDIDARARAKFGLASSKSEPPPRMCSALGK